MGHAAAAVRVFGNTLGVLWELLSSLLPSTACREHFSSLPKKWGRAEEFLGSWALPSQARRDALKEEPVVYSMCRLSVSPCPLPLLVPPLALFSCTYACVAVSGFLYSLKVWLWVLVGEISVSFVLICVRWISAELQYKLVVFKV